MKTISKEQRMSAMTISAALFSAAVTIVALAAVVDQFTSSLVI